MKKALLFVLIGANIAFFSWQLIGQDGGPATAEPVLPDSSLPLLTEQTDRRSRSRADDTPIPCWSLGPFRMQQAVERASARMRELDMESRTRKERQPAATSYWVYIPAQRSESAAKALLRQLHKTGVDAFVVADGPEQNAISIGVYNDRGHAERSRDELRGHGFDARLQERAQERETYWLDFHMGGLRNLPAAVEFAAATEFPGQQVLPMQCRPDW